MSLTNYDKKLAEASEKAWSFSGLRPPNRAQYIGSIKHENRIVNYYEDEEGNYYFQSDEQRKFELHMREVERQRKKRRAG